MATRALLLFLLLSMAGAGLGQEPARLVADPEAGTYAFDPLHTRIAFRIDHAGFSRVIGTFSGIQGRLDFDPQAWAASRLEVEIPIASLDLGDEEFERRILDPTFLDAGRHPRARFVSQRVEPLDASHARVHGELELHGVRRPVMLEVALNRDGRHPLTFRRTLGFSATARLRRSEFGIDAWPRLVGDEVELIIEAEARRTGRADNPETDDAVQEQP
jgi:polyisoprenoid-binding protein YceI